MSSANPYPGIRPFAEADAPLFFGREWHTNELLRKLEQQRFVAVVGSSGSGKSSLVAAGLIPAILNGFLWGVKNWSRLAVRPGRDPFGYLAEAVLNEQAGVESMTRSAYAIERGLIAAELRRSRNGLISLLEHTRMRKSDAHYLVVIDQFEELLGFRSVSPETAVSKAEAEAFVACVLRSCAEPVPSPYTQPHEGSPAPAPVSHRIWVVITMRSDFFGDCEAFPALAEIVSRSQFLVPHLTPQQREEVIRRPGEIGQIVEEREFEKFTVEPTLVQRIVQESGDRLDQLPLMAHALSRMWQLAFERRQREGGELAITFTDFEACRGIGGALDIDAEAAWATFQKEVVEDECGDWTVAGASPSQPPRKLTKEEAERKVRGFFLQLCSFSEDGKLIRRRPRVDEVISETGLTRGQVERLVRNFQDQNRHFLLPRLASQETLAESRSVDISHEAFLRQWKRYDKWQQEERTRINQLRILQQQVTDNQLLTAAQVQRIDVVLAGLGDLWARRYLKNGEWALMEKLRANIRKAAADETELRARAALQAQQLTFEIAAKTRALRENKRARKEKKEARQAQRWLEEERVRALEQSRQAGTAVAKAEKRLVATTRSMAAAIGAGILLASTLFWQLQVRLREQETAIAKAQTEGEAAVAAANKDAEDKVKILRAEAAAEKKKIVEQTLKDLVDAMNDAAGQVPQVQEPQGLFKFLEALSRVERFWEHLRTSPDDYPDIDELRKTALREGTGEKSQLRTALAGIVEQQASKLESALTNVAVSLGRGDLPASQNALLDASKLLADNYPRLETAVLLFDPSLQGEVTRQSSEATVELDRLRQQVQGRLNAKVMELPPERAVLLPQAGAVRDAVFWPATAASGRDLLLAGGDQGSVAAWDLSVAPQQPTQVWSESGLAGGVNSIAIRPDGAQITVATSSSGVKLFDLALDGAVFKTTKTRVYSGAKDVVTAVAYTASGIYIGEVGADGSARVFLSGLRGGQGKMENAYLSTPQRAVLNGLTFPPGTNGYIASTSDNFRVIVADYGKMRQLWYAEYEAPAKRPEFSPDGDFVTAAGNIGYGKVWRVQGGEGLILRGTKKVSRVTFQPRPRDVSNSDLMRTAAGWGDGGIRLTTMQDTGAGAPAQKNELLLDPKHGAAVSDVAWAPSGDWLASSDGQGQVFIWDCRAIDRPALWARLQTGASLVLLRWKPDQRWLAALAQSGECFLWRASEFEVPPFRL